MLCYRRNVSENDTFLSVIQAVETGIALLRYGKATDNETYEKIGKLSGELYGKTFTKVGVAASVNKMYTLIEQQPIWRKRWTIIKRIIKLQNEMVFEPQVPVTITIPKNVELTIKKE